MLWPRQARLPDSRPDSSHAPDLDKGHGLARQNLHLLILTALLRRGRGRAVEGSVS